MRIVHSTHGLFAIALASFVILAALAYGIWVVFDGHPLAWIAAIAVPPFTIGVLFLVVSRYSDAKSAA
jgi:hypothetical protein